MSVVPGYTFAPRENVTAALLARYVTGTISGVAASSTSMANMTVTPTAMTGTEGTLYMNTTTGCIEIIGRYGHIPVIGRGLFTRRFPRCGTASLPMFTTAFTMHDTGGENKKLCVVTDIGDVEMLRNFGEDKYCEMKWTMYTSQGQRYGLVGWVAQPSVAHVTGQDVTLVSCVTGVHQLWQGFGFTPGRAGVGSSAYTAPVALLSTFTEQVAVVQSAGPQVVAQRPVMFRCVGAYAPDINAVPSLQWMYIGLIRCLNSSPYYCRSM